MGWREYQDALLAAGIGPDDADEPRRPDAIGFVVHWLEAVPLGNGRTELARTFRPFVLGLWQERAARRWAEAMKKRHGDKNVWLEIVYEDGSSGPC